MGLSSNAAMSDEQKILLVGDIRKAFFDADSIESGHCELRKNISDAIESAVGNEFSAVGIVLAGMSGKLSSGLKSLRETSSAPRIILLAQMY